MSVVYVDTQSYNHPYAETIMHGRTANQAVGNEVEPTASFVELCSFVAIRQAQDSEEVVRQLLLHCFALAPDFRITRTRDFAEVIGTRFGLQLSEGRLQSAVDKLVNAGQLVRRTNKDYALSDETNARVVERLVQTRNEEDEVKTRWLTEVRQVSPELNPEVAWGALTAVLRRLFRRHGLQTLSLIGADVSAPEAEERSVRSDVREVCAAEAPLLDAEVLEASMLSFLQGARQDAVRASFIAHLADSTVSYYSLTVPPEVAARLRTKLMQLDVFLDTNVLFGLIGLAEPETTDAALELASIVKEYGLPLELRFHEETENELRGTFNNLAFHLRSRHWPPPVSRAAARLPNINTVTRLYHERNGESAISADTFLRPYEHVDEIIRDRGAVQYRAPHDPQPEVLYDLQHEYQAYLEERGREKTYETVMHDVRLLHTVRRLRVAAKSSLEARAIIVTNDMMLHLYETRKARTERRQPCTMLPRQLLQLLRPFVPATLDFDKSFAETFSAAAFRSIDGNAAAALGKLLELLAAYRDITEDTASAMLANDMILGKMQSAEDETELQVIVESALAAENASLQTERDSLAARLERSHQEVASKVQALEQAQRAFEEEKSRLQEERDRISAAAQAAEQKAAARDEVLRSVEASLEDERTARTVAEGNLEEVRTTVSELAQQIESDRKLRVERNNLLRTVGSVALAFLVASASELLLSRGLFPWLSTHQQSYGLRGATYLSLVFFFVGAARQDIRKTAWVIGVLPAVLVIAQLVGGPQGSGDAQRTHVPNRTPTVTGPDAGKQQAQGGREIIPSPPER